MIGVVLRRDPVPCSEFLTKNLLSGVWRVDCCLPHAHPGPHVTARGDRFVGGDVV